MVTANFSTHKTTAFAEESGVKDDLKVMDNTFSQGVP